MLISVFLGALEVSSHQKALCIMSCVQLLLPIYTFYLVIMVVTSAVLFNCTSLSFCYANKLERKIIN